MAYAVFAVETIGGIALILGAYTRLVSLAVIPVLLGATWTQSHYRSVISVAFMLYLVYILLIGNLSL
ncbi:hypothetical protein NBRC116188_17260 [Oceaniserpentilla sp. 4NH20-0058]|uniref:DoxX family membrane protein n=1 Tax=Oceaniserpentilla sp. 4NH20-0058 TaxID=3127660 RepID=UPI003104FA63